MNVRVNGCLTTTYWPLSRVYPTRLHKQTYSKTQGFHNQCSPTVKPAVCSPLVSGFLPSLLGGPLGAAASVAGADRCSCLLFFALGYRSLISTKGPQATARPHSDHTWKRGAQVADGQTCTNELQTRHEQHARTQSYCSVFRRHHVSSLRGAKDKSLGQCKLFLPTVV